MLMPIKTGFGGFMAGFFSSLVPTTPAVQLMMDRPLKKAIMWAPSRMVDAAEEMLAAWQKNDTDSATTTPPEMPVILVAMAVPEQQLQAVADKISTDPEVKHNYDREHTFNLWFVAIASNAEHLQAVLDAIEQETGYKTMSLPLLNDFFIDLGFKLDLKNA